jgi:NAD(P)-dependent dehydrogenase (short-subunit alcohol dehydrogenase family)
MPSKQKSILITGSVLLSPYSNYTVSTQGLLKTFHRCSKGGAGNALALEFAARGLRVFATARSLKSLDNLPEKGIETFILDVTNTESIIKLRDEIIKRTGGYLDILFNNAGSSKLRLIAPT